MEKGEWEHIILYLQLLSQSSLGFFCCHFPKKFFGAGT